MFSLLAGRSRAILSSSINIGRGEKKITLEREVAIAGEKEETRAMEEIGKSDDGGGGGRLKRRNEEDKIRRKRREEIKEEEKRRERRELGSREGRFFLAASSFHYWQNKPIPHD